MADRNKAFHNFYQHWNFVFDSFNTSETTKKLLTALYADDNILLNEDSSNPVFSCYEMDIVSADLNNINVDNTIYDENDPETIIPITILAWHMKFEKLKAHKKELNEKLMPIG